MTKELVQDNCIDAGARRDGVDVAPFASQLGVHPGTELAIEIILEIPKGVGVGEALMKLIHSALSLVTIKAFR